MKSRPLLRTRHFITLYGRLADKFGDNGLVSVLIGQVVDETVELDLWLMSCRVLKREMEFAMFDALVEQCQARGIRKIVGVYIPSKKNGMVAGHYAEPGLQFAWAGPPKAASCGAMTFPQRTRRERATFAGPRTPLWRLQVQTTNPCRRRSKFQYVCARVPR